MQGTLGSSFVPVANRESLIEAVDDRLLTFKAGAQLLILGCTWIIGLFQFERATLIMAYLFTIINSFQGAFILLVHCILNRQVREEYLRWFRPVSKPTSESQSSSITMSSAVVSFNPLKDGNTRTTEHSLIIGNTDSSSTVRWNCTTDLKDHENLIPVTAPTKYECNIAIKS
ncbi:adhesion G protein-coupled receptor E1-like [Pleurodeles waltl]|uniref:adhesion G protein-coupled receptor E1-like n=1 Tax=Pleurodeles waltl TaxID=8319 RepID=UPI003709B9CC